MTQTAASGRLRAPVPRRDQQRPRSGVRARGALTAIPFVGPAWLLVFSVGILPIAYATWLAFTNQAAGADHEFVGLRNFVVGVFQPNYLNSLIVTATFVVACTVVQFVAGYVLAYFLNLELRGHQVARTILLMPMLLTPVVIGLVFKFLFTPDIGIIDHVLSSIGVHVPWFTDAFWGKTFIILLDSWLFVPFVMLMLLAGMAGVSKDQLEAASLDGAGWWKQTRYVTLPALAPVISVAMLIRVVDTARMFDQVYSSTRGGPGRSTQTLSILIYNDTFQYFQFGNGAAMALALMLLMSPVYFLYIRLTRI